MALLDRTEILALLAQSEAELRARTGFFVLLAMLPIEQRIGEWNETSLYRMRRFDRPVAFGCSA